MAECVLKPCKDKGGELITLTRKAVDKIIQCSEIRKDGVKEMFLQNYSLQVHGMCRKTYILRPKPPQLELEPPAKIPRESFDFKTLCFLCGRKCVDVSKCRNPAQERWSLVQKLELIESIRTEAINRHDKWGDEVIVRLSQVIDLISSDGRYHWHCYKTFQKPGSPHPEKGAATTKGGSSADAKREDAYEMLCNYLEENDECQYAFEELQNLFLQFSPEVEPYTDIHLKRKLIQRYGNSLHFTVLPGKKSVICFSGASTNILSDNWYKNRNFANEKQEELRVIKTTAAIIRREIKSKSYNFSQFPTIEEITKGGSELVPEMLHVLISEIIQPTSKRQTTEKTQRKKQTTEKKTTTISHSIISAVRPRSFLSPVQLGTGVSLHRKFGSKGLIDILCNLGFCVPYKEVLKYERLVTSQESTRIENGYVQFVFDNADYNVHTLDGHNTFHVMGGIACVTPKTALQVEDKVPRKNITAHAVEKQGVLDLQTYKTSSVSGYSKVVATNLAPLKIKPPSFENGRKLNLFWLSGAWLEGPEEYKPGWSGCMEMLYASKEFQTSAVVPLPFINLTPSNPSTINTALLQAATKGTSNGQGITMVTFDQPLYAKAREMVAAAPDDSPLKSLFIRLGGFHLLMSFLSAIGFIMAGSGLEELYCTVYAKNSVQQMMNGKAYSRAVRALFLVEEALIYVILKTNDVFISANREDLNVLFSTFKRGNASLEEITQSDAVKSFVDIFDNELQRVKESGRTQKLWIQFLEMAELVRLFITAERSGDFHLHLHCVYKMLPIFHATGHLNYAKSAHVYLQDSFKLLNSMSPENDLFVNCGYFTIRRTEKFWSGVWSDMTIEQVLMRSLSSIGGLTGGRGITATTLATWINSMPACSRVCEAMEEFAGVRNVSSEQHVELREARQKRNCKDLQTFISWLEEHNPFSKSPELSSLSSGIVADVSVNCDEAFEVGEQAITSIENKTFNEIHLKRKLAVKSLASITKSITINNNTVCVNPNTLLHRMVCTVRSDERLEDIFRYELCAYPPSLFDECGLMRKGTKSSMVTALVSSSNELTTTNSDNVSYVIDGGHLLHRVVWRRPATFRQICEQYIDYVTTHYGPATVVFDGYDEENTKDEEHLRRSRSSINIEVKVEDSINVNINQSEFLANAKNKMGLISLLKVHLQRNGCTVLQASGDADLLIVLTAINESKTGVEACVIGDDTDLLVLLTVHAPSDKKLKMVVPKKGNQLEKVYIISEIQRGIGDMKDVLLAIYAFTGCDTVSAIYKKGKIIPYRKVQANAALLTKLLVFKDPKAAPSAVAEAGNYFLLAIFGAKNTEDVDSFRYQCYLQAIAKQPIHSLFKLAALPPTSAALRQHSFRTYHQVQQWLNEKKNPLEWGWKKIGEHLRPIATARSAAPQELLSLIVCTCKDECIRNCECRKSGLKCSSICGNCKGLGCDNRDSNTIEEDPEEDVDTLEDD